MAGLQRSTIATIAILGVPTVAVLAFTLWDRSNPPQSAPSGAPVATPSPAVAAAPAPAPAPAVASPGRRDVTVALSQWPGHLALVVGNGGLTTQPGSAAAAEGLDLKIVFIEDAPSKNKALQEGKVDAVWETVDELPIALGGFKAAKTEARAFIQIDWSRGGDACVASKEVKTVEDVAGRKAAVLMFSPDHTVLEFMLTNSRLIARRRGRRSARTTSFSMDDFTYARILFGKKQGRRRLPLGAGRDAGARQPARRAPPVLDGRRDGAGRRHAGRAPRVPGPLPRAGGEAGARLVRRRQEGGGRSPGRGAPDRHRLLALPRRAGLRRDAEGVRLGQVDRRSPTTCGCSASTASRPRSTASTTRPTASG